MENKQKGGGVGKGGSSNLWCVNCEFREWAWGKQRIHFHSLKPCGTSVFLKPIPVVLVVVVVIVLQLNINIYNLLENKEKRREDSYAERIGGNLKNKIK